MTNEEIKKAGEVMIAAAGGATVQCSVKGLGDWVGGNAKPQWDWTRYDYRIKPTKTLRPWKPEEVPLGAQLTQTGQRWLIVGSNGERVAFSTAGETTVQQLSDEGYKYSTDGGITWKRCGVEVES